MMRYFKQKCPVRFLSFPFLIQKERGKNIHIFPTRVLHLTNNKQEQNAKVRSRMNPTGPVKLSFRPNFQWQEPAPVRKQEKRPVKKEDELDTAGGPAFPTRESDSAEEESTVRRSTRRAAPRTKTSGLVPLHGLSDDFELLDNEVESYKSSSLSSEGNRHGRSRRMMAPPTRRSRDESRQQELAAADPDSDPDPTHLGPSSSYYAPRTLPRYELPNVKEPQDQEDQEDQEDQDLRSRL